MTHALFRDDPYLRQAMAHVVAVTEDGGIVLDQTVFYPTGGGQPGDGGSLVWTGGKANIETAVKGFGDEIVLRPADGGDLPAVGEEVTQSLDWNRRHRYMRIHTALHLLSVVVPLPVTGGAISAEKGRLDFNMPEPPGDKEALEARLNELIARDLAVTEDWISDAELAANPGMVKTMSVKPPVGAGRVRLIRIGDSVEQIDLQPCGGTHVSSTAEIGAIRIGKVEKKGAQNRRVNLHLVADG